MTEQTLKEMICRRFLNGDLQFPIDRHTRLIEEGIFDSLAMVQLVGEIERAWPGVRIDDQDITREHFGTIDAMLRFLEHKRPA